MCVCVCVCVCMYSVVFFISVNSDFLKTLANDTCFHMCPCMKQNFDAVIDVTIISYRYQYAEFTQPYTDPGVVMVVPIKSRSGHRAWLFVKPFTKTMWISILVMIIYNGFVLWMLERHHCTEPKSSMVKHTGTMAWLALTPLLNSSGNLRFYTLICNNFI